jgi:hypothetical protein
MRAGAERDAIEAATNLRHATIWALLDPDDRQTLLGLLAGLNGTGNPT